MSRDTILSHRNRTVQRDHLTLLIQQVSDDELEDAIALLEWLTDPQRRYLVDQLAGWSHHAERVAQQSPSV